MNINLLLQEHISKRRQHALELCNKRIHEVDAPFNHFDRDILVAAKINEESQHELKILKSQLATKSTTSAVLKLKVILYHDLRGEKYCNTLITLQHTAILLHIPCLQRRYTLQHTDHTATHCTFTIYHAFRGDTHCNTLITLQHTAHLLYTMPSEAIHTATH